MTPISDDTWMPKHFSSQENDDCKMHKHSLKMLYIERFALTGAVWPSCPLVGFPGSKLPICGSPGMDLSLWTHCICQLDLSYLPISWAMKSGGEIFEKVFPERALSLIKEIDYPDLKFFFHLHGMWDTGEEFSEVPAENCEFKEWFLAWVWGKVWAPFP